GPVTGVDEAVVEPAGLAARFQAEEAREHSALAATRTAAGEPGEDGIGRRPGAGGWRCGHAMSWFRKWRRAAPRRGGRMATCRRRGRGARLDPLRDGKNPMRKNPM